MKFQDTLNIFDLNCHKINVGRDFERKLNNESEILSFFLSSSHRTRKIASKLLHWDFFLTDLTEKARKLSTKLRQTFAYEIENNLVKDCERVFF